MNKIFAARGYFTVPDGTDVSPFLNATDVMQRDVPWGALGELSIAAGRIGPHMHSAVHVHPIVTQVTYVVSGSVTVRMKNSDGGEPYDLSLNVGEAAVTEPRTLFQLRNDTSEPANVLYIVSPSYIFEMEGGAVKYDDAVVVARTWEEFANSGSEVPALNISGAEARAVRERALVRLAERKSAAQT